MLRYSHSNFLYIRLGIRREDLPKYEERLEHKLAKAQLEVLKKEAIEAMETPKEKVCLCIYCWLNSHNDTTSRVVNLPPQGLRVRRHHLEIAVKSVPFVFNRQFLFKYCFSHAF